MAQDLQTHMKFRPAGESQIKTLYRLVCDAKGFSEIDALDDYVRDLLNVPDVRLASKNQVLSAIEFLQGLDRQYDPAQKMEFEII